MVNHFFWWYNLVMFIHFFISYYFCLIFYWWGYQDSNPDQQLRRMLCYPLHHTPSGEDTRIRTGITGFETPYAIHYTMPPNLLERNRTSGFYKCVRFTFVVNSESNPPTKMGLELNSRSLGSPPSAFLSRQILQIGENI